jgi:hypothetical protein
MLLAIALVAASLAQPPEGRVHGLLVDQSGGVLPGVTVSATTADGTVVGVAQSSDTGRYSMPLPVGRMNLTFSLEGFSTAAVEVDVKGDVDSTMATMQLSVAARAETVTVRGHVAVAPPPAPPPVLPPPPPPPRVAPLPEHDRDSVCGPAKPDATRETLGVIQSGRSRGGGMLFAKDDQLTIDGGTLTGLAVGRNLVARRSYRIHGDRSDTTGEHTAGVVQIVTAGERTATAVVVYACDEIGLGDWLAPFTPEPIRAPEQAGMPAYDDAARILFADQGQLIGAPRRFMVIDRGHDDGVRPGQRLTLFRPTNHGAYRRTVIGEAIVVGVRHDSSTIRIDAAIDAVLVGDWAAPQRFATAHQ